MATSNQYSDLCQLIIGMTANEKSYYKKLAKRHSAQKASLHLKLFDLIEKEQLTEDKKIAQKLNINSTAQLSMLKNHLSKDILDTLVFMKRNEEIDIQLGFLIVQLELLLEKKLLQFARKTYKKAWDLAVYFDHTDFQIQLLGRSNQVFDEKIPKPSEDGFQLRKALILQQQQQQQIIIHYEQLEIIKKTNRLLLTSEQANVLNTVKQELSALNTGTFSVRTLLFYHLTLGICEHLLLQFEKCAQHMAEAIRFWTNQPRFISAYHGYFLQTVNTVLYNDFALQLTDRAATHLQQFKQLVADNLTNGLALKNWSIIYFNTLLKINHKKANYSEVKNLIDNNATDILTVAKEVIAPSEQLSVMSSIAISYFALEEWNKAEEMLFAIKELNREINRDDIMHFATIFHLLIIYEKKEWFRLGNAIEAAYQQLYAQKKLRQFEKDLMHFLKRLLRTRVNFSSGELMGNFLKNLEDYKNDPLKKLHFLYFNYYGWLESKLMGLSYKDYVLKKHLESQE